MNQKEIKQGHLMIARICFGVCVAAVLAATLAASFERWDLFAVNAALFVANAGLSWFNYRCAA